MDGEAPAADAGSPAARLRLLRTRLDLSQEQLARRLGVSFATVNRWEAGRTRMSARAARALAEFEAEAAADGRDEPLASGGQAGPSPVTHSRFVGRERELAELSALLGQFPLVTVTGPGGVGKTRLVTEAIRRGGHSSQTVFIRLEPVRHPQSLIWAVASRLQVRDRPGATVLGAVEAALAADPKLIVLDGAEHVREEVARLVARLLAAAPQLRIVVTSRVVLGASGEVCWTVPPMACPSPAAPVSEVAESDAVQLFMARAAERLPRFTGAEVAPRVIAELCRRLDCLPLAIELIAGWVATFSVREILDQGAALLAGGPRIDGAPPGRNLGDVVRRSYDLLEPAQRRLLPTLSVFAAPFTAEDAAAVSGAGPALPHALRGMVDSSWLVVAHGEPSRFSMLETMRMFAAARLDEQADAAAVRRRHAGHFAALASASEQGLAGPDAAAWTARLAAAAADLDVALRWAQGAGDDDLGLEMSASLWRWWLSRGRLAAGRNWLNVFLPAAGRQDERSGRAYCSAAVLAAENGDYPEAIRLAKVALPIFVALGLRTRSASAETVLGSAHRYLGDRAAAERHFRAALELHTQLDDRRGMSVAINNLALLALDDGDLAGAQEQFAEALVIKRQLGDKHSLALGLANLSDVLIRNRQIDAAQRALNEAAELAAEAGNPQLTGIIQSSYGDLAAKRQRWAEAAAHYQASARAHEEGGHAHDVVVALIGLGRAAYRLGRRDEAARRLRAAEALAASTTNPQGLAEVRAALTEIGESSGGSTLPDGLTERQAEVLRLLAAGMSNKQIAAKLYLSLGTVERHLATVYRRLGVSGRVEAARYAVARGLAPPN